MTTTSCHNWTTVAKSLRQENLSNAFQHFANQMQINLTGHWGAISLQPFELLRFTPSNQAIAWFMFLLFRKLWGRGFVPHWYQRANKHLYRKCSLSIEVFQGRLLVRLMPKHDPHTEDSLWCLPCTQHKPFYKDVHFGIHHMPKSHQDAI